MSGRDCTTKSCLTNIFNERVVKAEHMKRPLNSSGASSKPVTIIPHEGVRVTTETGNQYLVHKGPNFGISSDVVVTPASNMRPGWTAKSSATVSGKTVNDFVQSGNPGKRYNAVTSNCIQAANRMMKDNKKKQTDRELLLLERDIYIMEQ